MPKSTSSETTPEFAHLACIVQPIEGLILEDWHVHKNPDGTPGGWVKNTARVAPTAFVAPTALVISFARVSGRAKILGHALINGWALVTGNAVVCERAQVSDRARVVGTTVLQGDVTVRGVNTILRRGVYSSGVITKTTRRKKTKK